MKNRKTKHLLVLAVCLAISVTCFWNCQSEDHHSHDYHIFGLENVSRKHQKRMVSLDDITDVREHVEKRLNMKLSQRSSEINGAIFDEDNVLEVIDSLDNANYSLRFRFPNTPIKEFYNLVVGKTPEGDLKTPYVLKYTCDDAFVDEFISNDFNFFYFKGTVDVHKYTDFFDVGSFSRTNTECETQFDAAGDPISCESNYVDGSSSTSGGGSTGSSTGTGNDGGGSNGTGSTGGGSFGGGCSYLGIYVLNCGGSNSDNLHLLSECGGPNKDSADQFAVWDCEGATRSARTADCPECGGDSEGAVGINPPSTAEMVNTVQNALNIPRGSDELSFLENNPDVTSILYNILAVQGIDNNYSQLALDFCNQFLELSVTGLENMTNEEIETLFEFNPDYKKQMSASERIIFDGMNTAQQAGYLFNAKKAIWESENLFPNSLYNGKGDAFRHAYFSGLNVILLGYTLAESLGTAHENKPAYYPYDYKEVQMDLFNNNVGRSRESWFLDGYGSLTESILDALNSGQLRYLSPLAGGASSGQATGSSMLIPTNQ